MFRVLTFKQEMEPANDLILKNLSIFPTISGSKCLEF